MSDPEELDLATTTVGLVDFSELRTAADHSDYSLLELQWNGLRFAAVPAQLRDGGVLLVLPEEAFSEEELTLASADGFSGFVGPYVIGSCTLRGARRVELQSEVPALIVDLDADILCDQASDGVLALCTEQSLRELTGFGLSKGRSLWLAAEGVRRLVDLYRKLASPGNPPHSRCSPYATGESGGEELPGSGPAARPPLPTRREASAGGVPDSRLVALEAQVRELVASQTALLAAQQGAGVGASGALKHGTTVPPLFEAEAGRAGLSLEQLTALLGAAGRPPDRLRDSRPTGLTGASSSGHLPLQGHLEAQAHPHPAGTLPKAAPPPLPTGVSTPVKGDLDATSLLAALVQQNNNLLGALTKNRGDTFGDYLDTEDRPSAGVRGYQARQQFQAALKRDPNAVYASVRRRLAEAIETDEATLPGAAMRTFFTNKVPLGSMRGLTYFAFATAQLWEAAERDDLASLKAQVALLAVYLEQVAVDGGRHQLGWLLTGMPNPPFQLVQSHAQRQEDPVGFLGDPRWVAANLAYLKDVDYLESRTKLVGGKTPTGDPAATPKQRPKSKPKGAPKAAAKPAAGGAGEAA